MRDVKAAVALGCRLVHSGRKMGKTVPIPQGLRGQKGAGRLRLKQDTFLPRLAHLGFYIIYSL